VVEGREGGREGGEVGWARYLLMSCVRRGGLNTWKQGGKEGGKRRVRKGGRG